jgi:hypothetical protein
MEATMTKSKAFQDGYRDGLAWDLDGFATHADVLSEREGWDTATINAAGGGDCAKLWGVPSEGPEWEKACEEYNAGAHAGASAPQSERTGKSPRDDG